MMKIREYPDPVLRIKSDNVEKFDKSIRNIVKHMKETMAEEKGVGLAANQIGITKRIIIIDSGEEIITMINPEIVSISEIVEGEMEGCLSFPDLSVMVERSISLSVKYQSVEGENASITVDGIFARAVLHEVNHIDGILLIDYLNSEDRFNYNMYITREKHANRRS